MKKIDPNHLYFGFWIVPGWWENEDDWRLLADHCEVIGYDLYAFGVVDVGDRPKWDLVERMRKANLSAAPLRLKAAVP